MGNPLYFRRPSTDEHGARFGSVDAARDFVLAGRADVVLRSEKSGERISYRVEKAADRKGSGYVWFVKTADAKLGFVLIGIISGGLYFRATQPRKEVKAFAYFWRHLVLGEIAPQLEILHDGRCQFCRHRLKDDAAIASGFGPDCVKRVQRMCFPAVPAAPEPLPAPAAVIPLRILVPGFATQVKAPEVKGLPLHRLNAFRPATSFARASA